MSLIVPEASLHPPGIRYPVIPSITASLHPPTSDVITGKPARIASNIVMGKPSQLEVNTKILPFQAIQARQYVLPGTLPYH